MSESACAITGVGLLTAVGNDAWSSAAAIHAGVSGYAAAPDFWQVLVGTEGPALEPAVVARTPLWGNQPRDNRAVYELISLAMGECLTMADHLSMRRIAFLPISMIEGTFSDPQVLGQSLAEDYPELGSPLGARDELEHCAFLDRVICAVNLLAAGKADQVLVACVDSWAAMPRLERLSRACLLKTRINPEGIVPGEAAGAVLVEREESARRRGARILSRIGGWGAATEPNPWSGNTPSRAVGLTAACRQAFGMLPQAGAEIGGIFSDLNGERMRGWEWGLAAQRLFKDDRERPLFHPADTVGDCFGAMGAVLTVVASTALAGGQWPPLAILSSANEGARRVLCLMPPT